MKRINVSTQGLEFALFVIASNAFFASGHFLAGIFCGTFACIYIHRYEEKGEKETKNVEQESIAYTKNQEDIMTMTPFEIDITKKAFTAGAKWLAEEGQ